MDVIIAGAGIGGLTTALALHAAGIDDVTLYESAPELRPLGVGINLLPHAVRELTELGLGEQLAAIGVATSTLSYFNRYGQQIWSEPRGLAAGYRLAAVLGAPRAAAAHAARRGASNASASTPSSSAAGSMTLRMTASAPACGSPSTAAPSTAASCGACRADVVVGADGIHCALRRQHYPDEGAPVWNGLILWRGTARVAPYLDGRTMIMAGDAEQKFVAYPLSAPGDDGLQAVNFIAEYRSDDARTGCERLEPQRRSVDRARPLRRLGLRLARRAGRHRAPPTRSSSTRWSTATRSRGGPSAGRRCSATPRTRCTRSGRTAPRRRSSTPAPWRSNSARRVRPSRARRLRGRAAAAHDAAHAQQPFDGTRAVMQLAYERAPGGFDDIDLVVPYAERAAIAESYKSAAGFVPEELNRRATLSVAVSASGATA